MVMVVVSDEKIIAEKSYGSKRIRKSGIFVGWHLPIFNQNVPYYLLPVEEKQLQEQLRS